MEGLRRLLDEVEFRFWWRVLPPCARALVLRELRRGSRVPRRRRWLYPAYQPIVIGA